MLKSVLIALCLLACLPTQGSAQRPARPIERARLVSAQNFVNPALPAPVDGVVEITGAAFSTDTIEDPLLMFREPQVRYSQQRAGISEPAYSIQLGGCQVFIGDEPQPLIAVSPTRILVVPRVLTPWLVIKGHDGRIYYAPTRMTPVAPGLQVSGGYEKDKRIALGLYFTFGDDFPNIITDAVIPTGNTEEPTKIILIGSGWRNASNITILVDGEPTPCTGFGVFAFEGQDQLGFDLPAQLAGRGLVDVVVVADGMMSNAVKIRL